MKRSIKWTHLQQYEIFELYHIFQSSPLNNRVLHCRNAPSPAATSSLAIARVMADRVADQFGLPKVEKAKLYWVTYYFMIVNYLVQLHWKHLVIYWRLYLPRSGSGIGVFIWVYFIKSIKKFIFRNKNYISLNNINISPLINIVLKC